MAAPFTGSPWFEIITDVYINLNNYGTFEKGDGSTIICTGFTELARGRIFTYADDTTRDAKFTDLITFITP